MLEKNKRKGKCWWLRETFVTMRVRSKPEGKVGMLGEADFKRKFWEQCSKLVSFQRQHNLTCGKNNADGSWWDGPESIVLVIQTWGPTFAPWHPCKKTKTKNWTTVLAYNSIWGGRDSRTFEPDGWPVWPNQWALGSVRDLVSQSKAESNWERHLTWTSGISMQAYTYVATYPQAIPAPQTHTHHTQSRQLLQWRWNNRTEQLVNPSALSDRQGCT